MDRKEIIEAIVQKYSQLGENPDTYLQGLLHAKPITYWDYIQVDTLLSLQNPRTPFVDEEIFIIYHQVTELVLKLISHEIKQICGECSPTEAEVGERITRANRYTSMLITSFAVMKDGMDYDDYNTFRLSLAPASGFQSVQFRQIELMCTRLPNLINSEGRKRMPAYPSIEDYFEHIYWRDAGMDRATGKKTLTLEQFESRYKPGLVQLAHQMQGNTLEEKVAALHALSPELKEKLKRFDRFYNIEWPKVHLQTARHYLDAKGEEKAATGGSAWKRYLHPMYQQRKFFPSLYTAQELQDWGRDDKEG
ncbi:MAG: tryptophan 2,3-dioxygenase [Bacteroidetes bacterium]|jgi:tryptophan 2,3-dioxygenase|nr:tryptophan 2,3-dioxygenase [Bacteroidota bacterium]